MLIFAFYVLNWSANSKVPRDGTLLELVEILYVAYMLAYASVLHLTICQITWSLWHGTRGLTKLGLKFMS